MQTKNIVFTIFMGSKMLTLFIIYLFISPTVLTPTTYQALFQMPRARQSNVGSHFSSGQQKINSKHIK